MQVFGLPVILIISKVNKDTPFAICLMASLMEMRKKQKDALVCGLPSYFRYRMERTKIMMQRRCIQPGWNRIVSRSDYSDRKDGKTYYSLGGEKASGVRFRARRRNSFHVWFPHEKMISMPANIIHRRWIISYFGVKSC